jgi:hypothetical protein
MAAVSRQMIVSAVLLPPEFGRFADPIEAFQAQDRVRKLIGAAIQYRAGKRQEFLRHRVRIRE